MWRSPAPGAPRCWHARSDRDGLAQPERCRSTTTATSSGRWCGTPCAWSDLTARVHARIGTDRRLVRHGEGDGGRRRPLAGRARPRSTGDAPEDWLDARDPEYIREALPAIRAWSDVYFRAEVHGLDEIPADEPGAAGRQPLRRHADRRHVRLLAALLRPLRRRPRASTSSPTTSSSRSPACARASAASARCPPTRTTCARALDRDAALLVYPGGDHETYRPTLGAGPDRLRRAHGLRQARARARHPDRAGRGDRRPGDGAVPRPGRPHLARAAARQGAAAEGVPGPGGAAVRPHAARPAAALPAAGQDQDPGAPADRPARRARREGRPRGRLRRSSPSACRTRCPSSRTSARCRSSAG